MGVIQIRGVSDRAHRRLKARAAMSGQSLSEYLRAEVEHLAALPTLDEMLDRVGGRAAAGGEPASESIRREREAREAG